MMTITGNVTWTSAVMTAKVVNMICKRAINQAELEQNGVDEAVVAEDNDPRIGPDHLAQEKRCHRDDKDGGLDQPILGMHQRVGNRIRDQRACRPR